MKISKDSYWLKSGFFTFLERLFQVVFAFGSYFFLLKILSKEQVGVWSLFLFVTSFIEIARNALIQNAMVKYLASAEKEDVPKIITASFILNCILTFISIAGLFIFADFLSTLWKSAELKYMFYLYTITTLSLIPFSQLNFIQQANLQFNGIFWSNMARQGFIFFFILGCFLTSFDLQLYQLVLINIAACFIGTWASYIFAKPFIVYSKSLEWLWVKKLFNLGKYVLGSGISSSIYNTIDQMMLGSLISTSSVAVYNAAIRITNLVEVPVNAVSIIVFPQSAKRIETEGREAIKDLYEKSVAVILALIVPCVIGTLIFAKYIILIVGGEKYMEAVGILRITILYTLFLPFARQFGTMLDSIGMVKTNFMLIMVTAFINGVINYFFIKKWGIMGAAYGTLTASSIFFIMNQIIMRKLLNVSTRNIFVYLRGFYVTWYGQAVGYLKK